MIFGIFTLIIALAISAIAAYYSIAGLTSIFAAAVVPIIIMGAALEIGKITAAVWLKLNWSRAKWTYKLYLVPAVTILMLLTSLGIFGFLSKAHSDQTLVTGDSSARLALFDEKIKIQRENIDTSRRALAQLDAQVNERLSRGTSEQGVERAATLRRQQTPERNRLLKDINDAQSAIQKLNEDRAPVAAELRKVEAEVGPIKYIAAMIYGPNPDNNLLEKAVSWMIIVIVAVFDPLALVLILAAQQSINWSRQSKLQSNQSQEKITTVDQTSSILESKQEKEFDIKDHAYLTKPWVQVPSGPPIVSEHIQSSAELSNTEQKVEPVKKKTKIVKSKTEEVTDPVDPYLQVFVPQPDGSLIINDLKIKKLEGDYYEVNEKKYSKEVFFYMWPNIAQRYVREYENLKSTFGIEFPSVAQKGEFFLRVDYIPNVLYKYNGSKWIVVDKNKTDVYLDNTKYIKFLSEKLQNGEYELDQLNTAEQDAVAEYLQKNNNEQT